MTDKMKLTKIKYKPILPYITLIAGVILFVFSNGRWIVPFAAWIAPVFLLRFIRSKKAFPGLCVLFLLITISANIMLAGIIPSLLGTWTHILAVYYAFLWFLPYIADKLLAGRIRGFVSTLVFPAAAVSAEFANTVFYGSWASVAYTQYDNLPFIQISSIVGMWGVTFIVMWFASVANWIIDNNFERDKIKSGAFVYSTILCLILVYGGIRLGAFPPDSNTVTVASFTATKEIENYSNEIEKNGFESSTEMASKNRSEQSAILNDTYDRVFEHNNTIITPRTSISIWPEGMLKVVKEDEPSFIERGRKLAKENNIYLLPAYFVIPRENPDRLGENKAVFINPKGEVEWQYLKTHPVPGSTDKAGEGRLPVSNTQFGRISAAICYDMDFTGLIHQASLENVDIMLVPAWDWKAIDPLHARMAVFRAIENGFSMVRQTGNGLSIAVDYEGRTLSAMDQFTSDNNMMISQIPVKGTKTIYGMIGDSFAWLCVAGFLFSIVWPFIKTKSRFFIYPISTNSL